MERQVSYFENNYYPTFKINSHSAQLVVSIGRSSDKTGLCFSQKPRLAARSNIISLIRTPRLLFLFFDSNVPQQLERASVVQGCTRLRLVSGFAKLKFTEEVSLDPQERGTLDLKVDLIERTG